MSQASKLSWWLYGAGLLIVLGTHVYMLMVGGLTPDQMTPHAVLNMVAGLLLAAGWLKR